MTKPSTRANLVANYAGTIWVAVLSVVFLPLYVRFMGADNFGLIGIYLVLFPLLNLLDLGTGATLNRELARTTSSRPAPQEIADLARTLEIFLWVMAVVIACVVAVLAPVIATHWVSSAHLTPEQISRPVAIMGMTLALQLIVTFYSQGILGLQRHVALNAITSVAMLVRYGGALVVLWLIAPTADAFFAWQAGVTLLQVGVLAAIFWSKLGISPRVARVRIDIVRRVWRLAAGIGATATLGAILMQTDKIIVSKLLTLDHFGYYMLAAIVASSVGRVATPIFMTIYPRFSQLVAEMNHVALASLYHKTTQLLSFLMLPATVVLALLPEQVLYVWTQDAEVAKQSRLILSILVVGTALNGMMHIPYALQLGYGYARLALYSNMIAIAVLVPLVSFLATRFGAAGAASGWLILNAGYFLISVQIMHRRLLPSEKGAWYLDDILKPLLPTLAVVLVARYLAPSQSTVWATALFVVTSTLAAYFASACATREVRRRILQSLKALPRSATRT